MTPSPESQREPLSRSVEDYLKAIHRLSAEGRPASTTQIAEALAVAPPPPGPHAVAPHEDLRPFEIVRRIFHPPRHAA